MPARMSFNLPNTQRPTQGPCAVNIPLDFTGGDNIVGDLALEQSSGTIEFVQSIYIDNSLNLKSLSITFAGLQYKITMKAGQQGLFPVIIPNGTVSWRAQSIAAGIVVPSIFFNVAQQPFLWQAV